ncbi:MAG TPA: 2-oxo-4-hydroxy-4-carboxy-5-ureidoimidazoline decarboxylase [Solirubrobacteraceae bacterium]|jgi:2-oxo-4-hydroxy-4-carboxy-5-ureidoimidazoline decarboxylase|nr:2-oxo-4-hydroxy-4-carboxy-5-ureidoimidazoline decarboxylase [Solirubrobacteraceae bacterium]
MPDTVTATGVAALNGLAPARAREALAGCCASERWVTAMERARPYASAGAVLDHAEAAFDALADEDWLHAFAAHARIGAPRADDARGAAEQAGAGAASAEERAALETGNERYEAKFGHVFLIRASGLDAAHMLAALRERLENSPAQELALAARQQREITRLRLRALLAP